MKTIDIVAFYLLVAGITMIVDPITKIRRKEKLQKELLKIKESISRERFEKLEKKLENPKIRHKEIKKELTELFIEIKRQEIIYKSRQS